MKYKIPVILGVSAFVLVLLFFMNIGWVTIQGSEVVVWQEYHGVASDLSRDGTYFYWKMTTTPHKYDINSETFVMSETTVDPKNTYMRSEELIYNQPDMPPIEIQVSMEHLSDKDKAAGKPTGPTTIRLECVMQYHLEPATIIKLHKEKTSAFRTVFMKDQILNTVVKRATILDARTVYQGDGRVRLQTDIDTDLKANESFQEYGIKVEQFVIRTIHIIDAQFLEKMTAEARAEQDKRTADKQKDAFESQAKADEAKATSEKLKRLVEAETKKGEMIAAAEADKSKQVLAAQAEFEKVRLAAEAQKERDRLEGEGLKARKEAEASGVLALGKAEAEAQRLKLEAYNGVGGERFAEVEKAKAFGAGIQKIYYIPSNMTINSISKDFMDAVKIGLPQHPIVEEKSK